MKFESEKLIFKPKIYNTLPIEHRLLGLKSFHKKIKTEVCIVSIKYHYQNFHRKVIVEFGNVKELPEL